MSLRARTPAAPRCAVRRPAVRRTLVHVARASLATPAPAQPSPTWGSWLADELASCALGAKVSSPRCTVTITTLKDAQLTKSVLRAETIDLVLAFNAQHTRLPRACTGTVKVSLKTEGSQDMLAVQDVHFDDQSNSADAEQLRRDAEFAVRHELSTHLMDGLNQIMWDCEKRSMEEVDHWVNISSIAPPQSGCA